MRITFRLKLVLLVASAVLTLALVVVISDVIAASNRARLVDIEARLLPRMQFGPRIEAEFGKLKREFQDAVAAQDATALDATLDTKNHIFQLIADAGVATDPSKAALLRWTIQDYYESAYSVSAALLNGDGGEHQLQRMAEMQRRLRKAEEVIRKATTVDHAELAGAFAGARDSVMRATFYRRLIVLFGVGAALLLGYWANRRMLGSLRQLSSGLARFSTGDFERPVDVGSEDELGDVAREANAMAANLKELAAQRDQDDWLRSAHVEIGEHLRGNLASELVAERSLSFLVRRTGATAGALYLFDGKNTLALASSHAYALSDSGAASEAGPAAAVRRTFRVGEGLVGQALRADEFELVRDLPDGYFKLVSGLGEAPPRLLVLLPLAYGDRPIGVVELALSKEPEDSVRELLRSVRGTLAIAFVAAAARLALEEALEESRRQADRLAAQEEELRQNNQELAAQQEELRRANEELETQSNELSERNRDLDVARERVMEKVEELGRVSVYKSQFLANMSHELRTPLNSMLLLSHMLAENSAGNLTAKQVEFASTIHSAGQDLLGLINQVLDLSKIESGKQEVELGEVPLAELAEGLARIFRPLAAEKGIELRIEIEDGAPGHIESDRLRIERILTNLVGNAIKFTERGAVTLRIGRPDPKIAIEAPHLRASSAVSFSVSDTGIGIAASELERIFMPFEQIEATSARRYQGTGLGLSIARESAILLGGQLSVASVPGQGSTFTMILPKSAKTVEPPVTSLGPPAHAAVQDDRAELAHREPHILVVEDDALLVEQLTDIIHARGLKTLVAGSGEEALRLAAQYQPSGIVLDVKLPDVDGWTVFERLRAERQTHDIPVHFLSALDAPHSGLLAGAIGYLTKPATRAELVELVRKLSTAAGERSPRVLIVEDHPAEGRSLVAALEAEGFEVLLVPNAGDALRILGEREFDCIVLDLGLPDMDGLALLQELAKRGGSVGMGVVIHTGRSLTKRETRELEAYSQAIVLKDGRSLTRLLEEIRLFVHHVHSGAPTGTKAAPSSPAELALEGRRVLVVEDDMRTAYTLLALLQSRGCQVTVSENGKEALVQLDKNPDFDCVLMDIMMPEMDGYETTRRLRAIPRFKSVPVIALTAKAMAGERERCLAAGASDYLSKPVDGPKLLGAIYRWTHREETARAV